MEKTSQTAVGVKRMGEMNDIPFRKAAKKMFSGKEVELKATQLCSEWEGRVKDPNWHPFKIVEAEDCDGHKV